MKKILLPIDFSKHSKYAAKLTAKIAKKTAGEIHLIHMIELPSGFRDMGSGANISIPESMLYIQMIKEKLLDYKNTFFADFDNVYHSIRFQNPYEGIRDYAKKINANLIIMGSKGQTALEEIIIGSNTEKTVRNSEIPVIITKKDNDNFKLKKLVFASSFENKETKAFEGFLEFAAKFKSKIYLLKINTPDNFENTSDSKKRIETFIEPYKIGNHTIKVYNDTSIQDGILNFSNENNVDLVSLATHGRSGLSLLFNSSISIDLSKNVLKPILTFKA
ncbi:universal stress protein [Tenacibaculum finnmarkense genomovar finnmarkense]|uniref:universal stress protein n=1 Tax=Tenacibaculum finnmarkense TaxID=2781243 RepID=UPI000C3E6395|nr:universal stress protein [Tenacibaculum finnmarkense]MBE7660168.1 universal stress protein [Tenacibaculum finnmarkense genomovar finnmarkense]MBE7692015.1 universal stress protein [Tenacibaculum finnmarkense genomovar finnmarkense]MCD8416819.1 universal stress protein [Tenacibaculum finnmarkense genomovar finnmarkense]MCD8440646.1 universal stress protein [Tenacibaculum finnmarkense genomovar ulcerans]MCD8453765.1 universal stress protein [Tenacibaculum finnmarkense genomovar ulcerans]